MGTTWKGELRIDIPETQNTLNIKGSLHPVSKSLSRNKKVNTKTACPQCASEAENPEEVSTLTQQIYCPECDEEYSWWNKGLTGVKEDGELVAIFSDDEMEEIEEERSYFMELLFITTKEQIENNQRIGHEGKKYYFAPRGEKEKLTESTQFYQYINSQIGDRYGVVRLNTSATRETLLSFTSQYVEELGREALVFQQIAFEEEMNEPPKYLKEADWRELDEEEREYAEKLISMLTEIEPDWESVEPEIANKMREMVMEKVEEGTVEVEIPEPEVEEEQEEEQGKEKLKALVEA